MTSRKPSKEDVEKGREIARLRWKRGLTQPALGHLVDRSGSQISKYELGKNRMSATIYEQLIAVLDPVPSATSGFSEGQATYSAPGGRSEDERQFLRHMMNLLQRRMDELGSS